MESMRTILGCVMLRQWTMDSTLVAALTTTGAPPMRWIARNATTQLMELYPTTATREPTPHPRSRSHAPSTCARRSASPNVTSSRSLLGFGSGFGASNITRSAHFCILGRRYAR